MTIFSHTRNLFMSGPFILFGDRTLGSKVEPKDLSTGPRLVPNWGPSSGLKSTTDGFSVELPFRKIEEGSSK